MNLRGILNKGAEAVFPSGIYCILCGSMIDDTRTYSLCDECIRKLHWIGEHSCDKCGKALPRQYRGRLCYDCMEREHEFERGYSCMTYGLHERELIFDYKYNGRGYMGKIFADMLYDRITPEHLDADVIIPVPIHKKRERRRGYNQTEIMAARLSELMGIPMEKALLKRTRKTPPLRGLNPVEREMALNGAFEIYEREGSRVSGRCILLVDDIYTTGATADACSKILMRRGADKVYFLSLASGGNRKPESI